LRRRAGAYEPVEVLARVGLVGKDAVPPSARIDIEERHPRPEPMTDRDLVPLAGVCLGRTVPIEHVRALVLAGRLAAPAPGDLVSRDYLAGVDPDPVPDLASDEWRGHLAREVRRHRDGRSRLLDAVGPEHGRRRDQQLTRIGSAAWGAALALTMEGREEEARVWFRRAATCYRRSLADAEPGSWGRCIGPLKALLLAGDLRGAERDGRLTLELGARDAASTTARYAGVLALLVVGRDGEAASLAEPLRHAEGFPPATARALVALARGDGSAYAEAVTAVLDTFETRDRFLEDIPVADTVMTLQVLARPRALEVVLRSPRLPR
jgi:hypothetical protein